MQVTEAIKMLTKSVYNREMIYYDIWKNKITKTKVNRLSSCPSCNGKYEYLDGKSQDVVKMCGTKRYQIKGIIFDFRELVDRFEKLDKVKLTDHCLFFRDIIVFRDGRVLVNAGSKEQAKSLYDKYLG